MFTSTSGDLGVQDVHGFSGKPLEVFDAHLGPLIIIYPWLKKRTWDCFTTRGDTEDVKGLHVGWGSLKKKKNLGFEQQSWEKLMHDYLRIINKVDWLVDWNLDPFKR